MDSIGAGVAEIIEKCDYDGERIIENLRRECERVLRLLEDPDTLDNIRRGWFGAYGSASLHDLRHAIDAVIDIYTKDRRDLEEACRKALKSYEQAMAVYTAIKAAPPEEH